MAVELDVDAPRLVPAENPAREQFAVHRVEHGVIPQENPNLEVFLAPQQPLEQLAELERRAVGRLGGAAQAGAAIELPAEDEDRALGREQRRTQRAEKVRSVDEHRGAFRVHAAPTGFAFDEQRGSRGLPGLRGGLAHCGGASFLSLSYAVWSLGIGPSCLNMDEGSASAMSVSNDDHL